MTPFKLIQGVGNFFFCHFTDMGINLCRFDGMVSQQFLYMANIDVIF